MVAVMVTAVVRMEVVISSNFFSCSPHPSLKPTASQPVSSGGGDGKLLMILVV